MKITFEIFCDLQITLDALKPLQCTSAALEIATWDGRHGDDCRAAMKNPGVGTGTKDQLRRRSLPGSLGETSSNKLFNLPNIHA